MQLLFDKSVSNPLGPLDDAVRTGKLGAIPVYEQIYTQGTMQRQNIQHQH